jgi:hypothetical protein
MALLLAMAVCFASAIQPMANQFVWMNFDTANCPKPLNGLNPASNNFWTPYLVDASDFLLQQQPMIITTSAQNKFIELYSALNLFLFDKNRL